MSLTAIKSRLALNLNNIQGVKRVFDDKPEVSPVGADMPCVIIGRQHPFLSITGDDLYIWRFELLFMFKTAGESTYEEWDSGIEPFFRRFRDALNADLNFGQLNTSFTFSNEVDVDFIPYKAGMYWGFRMQLDVSEFVSDTTYATT